MNPAVTTALWLMDVFPAPSLVPYIVAQLAGSVTGTALARLVWGSVVAQSSVDYGVIRHALNWGPALVFLTETGCVLVLALLVGCLLTLPLPVTPSTLVGRGVRGTACIGSGTLVLWPG